MARRRFRELYYITHLDNLASILEHGILSHAEVERRKVRTTPIYDEGVVAWRREIKTPHGLSLWQYANVYFRARNPMLYRVLIEKNQEDIVVLGISKDILRLPGVCFITGNAARLESQILEARLWPRHQKEVLEGVDVTWWSEVDGSKRRIMAEVLVPGHIPPKYIHSIYVADNAVAQKVRDLLQRDVSTRKISVIPEPEMFFRPKRQFPLTSRLKLVEGDMFFSRMQTLTISVNTVGVMGKGLASRAKYQFPDAYVVYQDACRRGDIQPGKPYLYKREGSLDALLADDVPSLISLNRRTWFLFFPTKRHWRERSRIEDIEAGLAWIVDNYKKEGIESLALPALGCGLGGLEWREVGPLMCRYLAQLELEVHIHLPLEKSLPEEQLRAEFLLAQTT